MSYFTHRFDGEVVRLLRSAGVGALPSDTIYGLSCLALDKRAVERLHKIKHREPNKPFVVLISRIEQLKDLGMVATDAAPALRYWPGKLTIICDAEDAPAWLHRGTRTLAVRQPETTDLKELIDETGPLISTSANISGRQPAATISQIKRYFGDKLDFYVDRGRLSGQPSTIIKPVFGRLEIIRQGAVKVKQKDRL